MGNGQHSGPACMKHTDESVGLQTALTVRKVRRHPRLAREGCSACQSARPKNKTRAPDPPSHVMMTGVQRASPGRWPDFWVSKNTLVLSYECGAVRPCGSGGGGPSPRLRGRCPRCIAALASCHWVDHGCRRSDHVAGFIVRHAGLAAWRRQKPAPASTQLNPTFDWVPGHFHNGASQRQHASRMSSAHAAAHRHHFLS